jgi:arylsulfatase
VDTKKIPYTAGITFTIDESFGVGSDTGTPVDDKNCRCPFPFTGKPERLAVKPGPLRVFPAEKKQVEKKVGERD